MDPSSSRVLLNHTQNSESVCDFKVLFKKEDTLKSVKERKKKEECGIPNCAIPGHHLFQWSWILVLPDGLFFRKHTWVDQLLLKVQTNEFTFQVDVHLLCLKFPTLYQITRLRLSDTWPAQVNKGETPIHCAIPGTWSLVSAHYTCLVNTDSLVHSLSPDLILKIGLAAHWLHII